MPINSAHFKSTTNEVQWWDLTALGRPLAGVSGHVVISLNQYSAPSAVTISTETPNGNGTTVGINEAGVEVVLPNNRVQRGVWISTPADRSQVDLRFSNSGATAGVLIDLGVDDEGSLDAHHGIVDYNDTSTAASPITLQANTWTTLPNNGEGSFTRKILPPGITRMLDPATGGILIDEYTVGSTIDVRPDFTVTPDANNADLAIRLALGAGAGQYYLTNQLGRLNQGAGVPDPHSGFLLGFYAGDDNTINNPVYLQVKLTSSGTLTNAGFYAEVYKR